LARQICSMVLALRKKEKIKVRQPLQRILMPAIDEAFTSKVVAMQDLILSELNVKELNFLPAGDPMLVKTIKADFKALGPKFGKMMKSVAAAIAAFDQNEIARLERTGQKTIEAEGQTLVIEPSDVVINTSDIPGWTVSSEGRITVALDIRISEALRSEGLARELVNRIQNLRKDSGLDVTDRIDITMENHQMLTPAAENNLEYICAETLTDKLTFVDALPQGFSFEIEDGITAKITIEKRN